MQPGARDVRLGVLLGTAGTAQLLLLAALGALAALGPAGWLVGAVHAAILLLLTGRGLHRAGGPGPADAVTTGRAVLGGGVAALVADGLAGSASPTPALVGLAGTALVLDAVDGRVARRTATATGFGARFDMEIDAVLIMVLAVRAAGEVGAWVLVVGAMRYAFVAAGWVLPWLRAPLPPSRAAKVVAAVQGIVLLVVCARVLPGPAATAAAVVAAGLLVWSFGRSVTLLHRARTPAGPRMAGPVPDQ